MTTGANDAILAHTSQFSRARPPLSEADTLTTNDDLDDLDDRSGFELAPIDFDLVRSPAVVRALAAIAVATMVLAWPDRSDRILARLIGLAILVLASTELWAALGRTPRRVVDAGFEDERVKVVELSE